MSESNVMTLSLASFLWEGIKNYTFYVENIEVFVYVVIKIFIHSSEISSVLFDLNQWQLKINIALELCWNEPWHSLQN